MEFYADRLCSSTVACLSPEKLQRDFAGICALLILPPDAKLES